VAAGGWLAWLPEGSRFVEPLNSGQKNIHLNTRFEIFEMAVED
jgi:hypothetical protein